MLKKPQTKCVYCNKKNQPKNHGKRTKYQTKKVKQREVHINKANLQHGAAGDACGC